MKSRPLITTVPFAGLTITHFSLKKIRSLVIAFKKNNLLKMLTPYEGI
jgi:hypothetical protein